MRDCYVHGLGFWRPGYANFASWRAQRHDDAVSKPVAAMLAGPLKRRASMLTKMAIEVFSQAADSAGTDVSQVKSVWALVFGEIHTAVTLMNMMHEGEGKLSPTRFHNSVYNTASGYASIATHNQAPSTTISGGPEIIGMGLLEAIGMIDEHGGDVIAVWADEPPPIPFALHHAAEPLALAIHLSAEPGDALARLGGLRREPSPDDTPSHEPANLYSEAALPLFEHITSHTPGSIRIEQPRAPGAPTWSIDVAFGA